MFSDEQFSCVVSISSCFYTKFDICRILEDSSLLQIFHLVARGNFDDHSSVGWPGNLCKNTGHFDENNGHNTDFMIFNKIR